MLWLSDATLHLSSTPFNLDRASDFKIWQLDRGKNEFWATSKTIISYTSTVDVSPDIALPCLPEKMPPDGLNHSLQEALNSPEKSSIMGKIVKVDMCNF